MKIKIQGNWFSRMQRSRLRGTQRTQCKIVVVTLLIGISTIVYLQLGFHIRNDILSSRGIFFQVESDPSHIELFDKTKEAIKKKSINTSNPTVKKDGYKTVIEKAKTGPKWEKEIPIIEAKDQPERLQKLPFYHCFKYTCEKPSHFPDLRLDEVPVAPSARNVTPSHERSSFVFYNRVNKCGSSTINAITKALSSLNSFNKTSSSIFLKRGLSWDDQEDLASSLNLMVEINNSFVYDRHVYFINFTRYGLEPPIWINFIREPVDRFISLFYFHRQPINWSPRRLLVKFYDRPKPWWFKKELDDCVQKDDPECVLKPGGIREMQYTFFCGHHPACMEVGNVGALQRAKRHVETAYSAVGVLEDLSTSLKVLEHYVPRFFRGMSKISTQGIGHKNKGYKRLNVSEKTKQTLRNMMSLDIDFYNFARQRLHLQSQMLPN